MNCSSKTRLENAKRSNERKAEAKRQRIAERDAVLARVLPGEVAIMYCTDTALCSCPPMPREWRLRTVPLPDLIFVGRNEQARTDRCLFCGTAWTLREYRFTPSKIVFQPAEVAA